MTSAVSIIPDARNAEKLAVEDLLVALSRITDCQTAEDAKIYVERALAIGTTNVLTGYVKTHSEVIRAIERRLPAATPEQREKYSVIKVTDGKVSTTVFARVVGAFGDELIILFSTGNIHSPFVVRIAIDQHTTLSLPEWDTAAPKSRRKHGRIVK